MRDESRPLSDSDTLKAPYPHPGAHAMIILAAAPSAGIPVNADMVAGIIGAAGVIAPIVLLLGVLALSVLVPWFTWRTKVYTKRSYRELQRISSLS